MHLKRKILTTIAFSFVSLYGYAAIPPQIVLDTQSIKPVVAPAAITIEDIAKVIPTNLQPGTKDEEALMAKIMDHSVNTFMNGDFFRNTELGKAATTVESALKTEVALGPSEDDAGNPIVQHKFNFQVAAFEQKAFLTYSGLTHINLTYVASDGLNLSLNQPLSQVTTLTISHLSKDDSNRVNLSWPW